MSYEEEIIQFAENNKDEMFYNIDANHAKIVLRELMKNATQYVYIVCCNMCSDVSNNDPYIEAVKKFLSTDPQREIKILFTNYDSDCFKQTKIEKTLREYPQQVSIKALINGKITGKGDNPVNFTVSDDKAFRMEIDVNEKTAFGNFNNPPYAKILRKHFDRFFNNPQLVDIAIPS